MLSLKRRMDQANLLLPGYNWTGAAAIASAAIGAGATYYSTQQAKEAQEEAQAKTDRAAAEAEAEARRIFEATKPEEATFDFGASDSDPLTPSYSEFLTPSTSKLGGSKTGSSITSTLGFGL